MMTNLYFAEQTKTPPLIDSTVVEEYRKGDVFRERLEHGYHSVQSSMQG